MVPSPDRSNFANTSDRAVGVELEGCSVRVGNVTSVLYLDLLYLAHGVVPGSPRHIKLLTGLRVP